MTRRSTADAQRAEAPAAPAGDGAAPPTAANAAALDVSKFKALTLEVVSRVRGLRELLEARATALHEARAALEEFRDALQKDSAELVEREQQLRSEREQRPSALAAQGQESAAL